MADSDEILETETPHTGAPGTGTPEPAVSGAAARAVSLVKTYGKGDTEVRALDGVDIEFGRNEFTAIMGPSGSGKSTLMHVMAGLDSATTGSAYIGETDLSELNDKELTTLRRDRLGFIFQSFNLVPTLTAAENITTSRCPRALRAARLTRRGSMRLQRASAWRSAWTTARRSCRAASSSASPAPARW